MDLLRVLEISDEQLSVSTDFEFPESELSKMRFDREEPLYKKLTEALRQCGPQCHYVIRMLESARKDARYNYERLHPELEKPLLEWRRNAARARNIPAYYVLHTRVILGIADASPQSEEQLLAVPGFGPGLFARYGEEILAITHGVQ